MGAVLGPVLVTGGARGIGKAIVQRFLQAGARVAFLDVDVAAGEQSARDLSSLGDVLFVPADVADPQAVRHALEVIGRHFGSLRVLVNNAALADPASGDPGALSLERWNRVLAVNLTGPFLCVQASLELLRRDGGVIVNIASTRALQSEPETEAYSASKGGLVALTHALANSLGPRIRVNCISPGWIATEGTRLSEADHRQHPAGRVGVPEDIAAMVLHLASPAGEFITGANLVIDGGMTRKMIYL